MTDPIMITCEGSGGQGNRLHYGGRAPALHCQMCNQGWVDVDTIPEHPRKDLLAMIDRGDFDG